MNSEIVLLCCRSKFHVSVISESIKYDHSFENTDSATNQLKFRAIYLQVEYS